MKNVTVLGLIFLCLFGCQRDSQIPVKPTQNADSNNVFNDKSQVRLAVYEYLIEKEIKPVANTRLFIDGDVNEITELKRRFPSSLISSTIEAEPTNKNYVVDKTTKQRGIIVEIKEISLDAVKASVYAGYFSGAGITMTFKLQKDKTWHVLSVSGLTVADPG